MKKLLLILLCAVTLTFVSCSSKQDDDALPGVFSVSDVKKVRFSPGNLQYNPNTNVWRFAESQLEYIGEGNIDGNDESGNGFTDLFAWSTTSTNFGLESATNYYDYSDEFVDWGTNMGEYWFTLTNEEWHYMRHTRPNADNLYGVACVDDVNGVILLPDDWTLPAGVVEFIPGEHRGNGMEYYELVNYYTLEEWQLMESAGAVFLPAAGYRNGKKVYNVQRNGYYWANIDDYEDKVGCFFFRSNNVDAHGDYRFFLSVRLVKEFK